MRLGIAATFSILLGVVALFVGVGTVSAQAAKPSCTISITPASTYVGSPVLVKWTSSNATSGTITPTIGSVGPSGSKNVFPPTAAYTTYRATFSGPGGTATCQAGVSVSVEPDTSGGRDGSGSSGGSFGGSGSTGGFGSNGGTTGGGSIGTWTGGLVPCGNPGQEPCQACHLVQLAQNIVNFFIYFSIAVATLMFAWAGILYVSGATNPKNIETAHSIFWNVFVGLIIVLSAWLLVDVVMKTFVRDAGFGPWNKIQCVQQPSAAQRDLQGFRPGSNPELGGGARRESGLEFVPQPVFPTDPDRN